MPSTYRTNASPCAMSVARRIGDNSRTLSSIHGIYSKDAVALPIETLTIVRRPLSVDNFKGYTLRKFLFTGRWTLLAVQAYEL